MAASEELGAEAAVRQHGEAAGRDAVGGIHGRLEVDAVKTLAEEAEEGRRVVAPETAGEARVGDEAAPALADGGDTRQ
jgi:hypothetical protein